VTTRRFPRCEAKHVEQARQSRWPASPDVSGRSVRQPSDRRNRLRGRWYGTWSCLQHYHIAL